MTLVRVITRGHFFRKFAFSFQTISDVAWNRPCPVVIYIFDCVSRAMVSGGDLDMVPSSWRKNVSTRWTGLPAWSEIGHVTYMI